jgi:hypothetical protein
MSFPSISLKRADTGKLQPLKAAGKEKTFTAETPEDAEYYPSASPAKTAAASKRGDCVDPSYPRKRVGYPGHLP